MAIKPCHVDFSFKRDNILFMVVCYWFELCQVNVFFHGRWFGLLRIVFHNRKTNPVLVRVDCSAIKSPVSCNRWVV